MIPRVGIALVSLLCTACLGSTYEQKKEIGEVAARIKLGMPLATVQQLAASAGADQVYLADVGSIFYDGQLPITKEKDFCKEKSKRLVLKYWQGAHAFLSEFDVLVVVDFDAKDVVCAHDVISIRR